jgi:hypothetical protein
LKWPLDEEGDPNMGVHQFETDHSVSERDPQKKQKNPRDVYKKLESPLLMIPFSPRTIHERIWLAPRCMKQDNIFYGPGFPEELLLELMIISHKLS